MPDVVTGCWFTPTFRWLDLHDPTWPPLTNFRIRPTWLPLTNSLIGKHRTWPYMTQLHIITYLLKHDALVPPADRIDVYFRCILAPEGVITPNKLARAGGLLSESVAGWMATDDGIWEPHTTKYRTNHFDLDTFNIHFRTSNQIINLESFRMELDCVCQRLRLCGRRPWIIMLHEVFSMKPMNNSLDPNKLALPWWKLLHVSPRCRSYLHRLSEVYVWGNPWFPLENWWHFGEIGESVLKLF